MKIIILTAGVLPVPPVQGGAVEHLIDYLLEYNENKTHHHMEVFGINDSEITPPLLAQYKYCRFDLFNTRCLQSRIKRSIYAYTNKPGNYHYAIDYFIHQAIQKIKKKEFDILLVENRPYSIQQIANHITKPIVLHLHNDTLHKAIPESEHIVSKVDKVITVSNYLKQRVNSIPLTSCKAETIYNGIDLNLFNGNNSLYCRKSLSLSQDDFVAVYTGRIEAIKGIKELVEAFRLLSHYPTIKLLIAGGSNYGDSVENSFVKNIKSIAASLNSKIIFTGYIPYNNIPSLLQLCDIAIIPSICEEALSLSAIESLACGLPLIITRSGGLPETIDNECAIVLDKDENLTENLATAIVTLYQDTKKRKKMSLHAKKRAKQFSKEKYAEQLFKTLEEIHYSQNSL